MGQESCAYRQDWLKQRAAYRANTKEWPRNLMSFELWCVATGYDPTKADGGRVFQQLMHYLLVRGVGQLPANAKLEENYYTRKGRGPKWGAGSPREGKLAGATKGNAVKGMHSPVSQGVHARGGSQGHVSGVDPGFHFPFGTAKQKEQSLTWQTSVARIPCSKLNWMQSLAAKQLQSQMASGVVHASGQTSSNSSEVQFATVGTTENCKEIEGCMAFANLAAAILGLYFYPGCDEPANNWTVTQRIDATTYEVRMRMWNRNYAAVDGGRLLVSEPLNDKTHWPPALGRRVVGGKTESVNALGFLLPDVFQEGGFPLEASRLIRGPKDDKTRLAPFFGSVKPRNAIGASNANTRNVCKRLSQLWGGLVHEPDSDPEGAYFGFNVAKAHWLYPHYVPDADEIAAKGVGVRTTHKTTSEVYGSDGAMQPWPSFKLSFEERSQGVMAQTLLKFYEMFDIPEHESADKRRKHALGAIPAATVAPPSQVQSVTRPPAPTATPNNTTGEQTLPDSAVETTNDGDDEDMASASRQEAALDVGFVRESALNIESLGAMLEGHGAGGDAGIETDVSKLREAFNDLAGFNKTATEVEQLAPGAPTTRTDLNPHWYSARHQPWPHKDLYDTSGLQLQAGEVLGEEKLREYERRYGSTHNLYLRGEKTPKSIVGIEQQFGFAKGVLMSELTENTELHYKHMCRILAIYFYRGEIGTKRGGKISAADKREGMLRGVWAKKYVGTQSEPHVHFGKQPSSCYVELWPPVFTRAPDARWAKWFDFDVMRGDNNNLHDCLVADKLPKIKSVKSKMTVMQWVTSPWHYAFLPYQPQSVLFNDGETYSEGCLRCARPFYEFEKMYASYRLSAPKTQHWPTGYWTVGKLLPKPAKGHVSDDDDCDSDDDVPIAGNECGRACAPVPFHYKDFWSRSQAHRANLPDEPLNAVKTHVSGIDEYGGWHNWPTYAFELKEKSQLLSGEFQARKETLKKSGVMSIISRNEPLTFRRYLNHVWDPDRVAFWGDDYPVFAQGRLSRGKVKFGMRGFMLQRASKYGNVCRDCAAVLELAPGLFHRNHRTVYDTGMVVGNRKRQKTAGSWWANLIRRINPDDVDMFNFDPDALHHSKKKVLSKMTTPEREKYLQSFEASMSTYAKYLGEQHDMALGSKTKYKEPPDIYIQKAVPDMPDSSKTLDHEMIQEAIRDLRTMLDEPPPWKINTKNKAFRDMVYELERKYCHKDRFGRSEGTKVFDSEMMRLECRNEKRGTFENCLVTRTYQPRGPAIGSVQNEDGSYQKAPEEDYVEKVYYATRHGAMGDVKHDASRPTMWCGDGYVTRHDPKKEHWVLAQPRVNNPVKQWRKMRQSRLFITYSLHRAVTSEHEGRLLMERMADAAHELFGNDANLSELLVFGYKLGGFSARGETTDTISKAQFELIQKPNKKDAVKDFYGEPNASSYIYDTYETHIDSVDVDGGIEIGPNRHHPHFHILVTINHWSYVQIDYFKMNAYLEMMFRGLDPLHRGWGKRYKLLDASGGLFYTDNENPHVDIRLYPQDNWQDIINAYVRKNATPSIMESLRARTE